MAFRNQKIILILLQFAAFWSVWRWYFLRLSTSSDEFYGVLALAAIGILSFKFGVKDSNVSNFKLIIPSIVAYAIAYPFLPPLLVGVIAITSLTFTVSGWQFGRRFHFGIWVLFLLSLPVIASMQFYLGFPLRVLVGDVTVWLLKLNGLAVFRDGVCLHFGEQLIWIDAPCSGIKMLWAGFFLTSLLITVYGFRLTKSAFAYLAAFGIILLGNIFRATGLFYLEAGIIKMPAFAHDGIGVTAFILTCIGIVTAILKIKTFAVLESKSVSEKFSAYSNSQFLIFAAACFLAFIIPFSIGEKANVKNTQTTVNFPEQFENQPLKRLELSEREEIFTQDFPGEIRRYAQGNREIIIRYVTEPTRKLHPASDCFSAIGYKITPLPLKIDETQQKWSCFRAAKDSENLKVCERIFTESGDSWTDVSSWYWSAITREDGGYWALTVAEIDE